MRSGSFSERGLNISWPWLQAGKILANILVAGATVLFRAGAQAYRQAIISRVPASIVHHHAVQGDTACCFTQLVLSLT